ncbi:hypothetical protein BBJ29_006882 [Phytophthora kernoviae]|uniref:CS domain-containing protein n=1 Tax=Phytophthora kernoviae TaxID=325452 RepID=A0A3F2RGC9_9STRA|nr:hypothetical protein BBJ29_006882 [Phytophthora kernoviae]RLN56249.1 hypothetical protein BBP00_00008096 [Phytophthora kernoviae]
MGDFFLPYVYVPSAEGTYLKLVTPWGNVQMNKGLLLQLAGSVGVIVFTLLLIRCAANLNAALKKKVTKEKGGNGEDGDEEEDEEEEEEEEEPQSVLDEKMITKGDNSYYYTHQHQGTNQKNESVHKTMVSSYGWSDMKKTVDIYLTDNAVMKMRKEQLVLKWTNTSLSMDLLSAPGGCLVKSLAISTLFQEITDVTWAVEKDTLTLTLVKAQELPWKSLNGAARKMEEHIEYDDSLYE